MQSKYITSALNCDPIVGVQYKLYYNSMLLLTVSILTCVTCVVWTYLWLCQGAVWFCEEKNTFVLLMRLHWQSLPQIVIQFSWVHAMLRWCNRFIGQLPWVAHYSTLGQYTSQWWWSQLWVCACWVEYDIFRICNFLQGCHLEKSAMILCCPLSPPPPHLWITRKIYKRHPI